ncbi:bifunctional methyltransferase/pyrophosphohydrolase YabN [Saccharibacillus alkalitolerans]|uniref:Nucleoside triphosphate pyrophosphohydrolase n=1 Tax=Saccharibacillus alkalitolerans TaxID=2705290 RepID=A0ABX0FB10_9BACL|nr:nucleoside triphosphate pyrophosphohydrolase [Saccharibacillus alkalitolerans]NGZ78137.1 nucleoside triphosphate pyrophosphohydrolase [Saccharibacillus alkalitolerans]
MGTGITVVGLGSGDPDQLTLGIWKVLQGASRIYVRTKEHPVMNRIAGEGIAFESFDSVYENNGSFSDVYETIARRLVELAASGELVYAVPGHPMVAEKTVLLLREYAEEAGIPLKVLGGESFLDQAFVRLGFDPIEGFQLLDSSDVTVESIRPSLHTLIGQVYDSLTASEVKLGLMEVYPDDHPVIVGHALGVEGEERILRVPLYELDRLEGYGNLSLVYIPKADDESLTIGSFARLHEIVGILRSPGGCPWDMEQTHASIRKNLIEETYEVLETIDDDDPDHMREELGDLLLQIMLHSRMEEEVGTFTVYDVIRGLNEKLIFRHPHVFGDRAAGSADEALKNWDAMKAEEKKRKGASAPEASLLDGVPRDLPALMKAYKLQKKAAKAGFDWEKIEDVFAKIEEELGELREALAEGADSESLKLELGDLLFSAVNASRFLDADPEEALSLVNDKFRRRFRYIEDRLREQGSSPQGSTLEEMDALWNEAKGAEQTK